MHKTPSGKMEKQQKVPPVERPPADGYALKRLTEYHAALEDVALQFALQHNDATRRWLSAGGLSALEHAFDVLGWDDPHYIEDGGCEIAGCPRFATCVGGYPRSLAADTVVPRSEIGFGYLCSEHFRRWNGNNAETAPDLGRSPHP